ncbi:MAG: phosphoenolpyruvate--protein phosphotransferase [Planctomycetota bacterium]|nr:phosphoenolpyruvate--protein phosphotransferase [Planctomycetota bacterium]
MQILEGIAVSPGVAIGEVVVIDNEGFRIPTHFVTQDVVDDEVLRLDHAIAGVSKEIAANRDKIAEQLGEHYGAIFSAHLQMLQDAALHSEIELMIREKQHSAEYAVSKTLRRYAKVFQQLDDQYLAERAHDIFDLEKSLLGKLLRRRRESLSNLSTPLIVLAHNLTPSETAKLDPRFVLGFATEIGGPGSHTAIVAKGLEIPAVVATGQFLADVSGGDVVIVDGDHGQVIIQPDKPTLARYRDEVEHHRSQAAEWSVLRDQPAVTTDGTEIQLGANIEFPHEVATCLERGASVIGLYRTEFLYLGVEEEPTEEDHFVAYTHVIESMAPRQVVIRTLDLGADKMGQLPLHEEENNPFLGVRSIRLSLRNLDLFRIQLRAALRASALGSVRIMFPMISTLDELRQAKMLLIDTMEDLGEDGFDYDENVEVGMMVEVPSAVMMLDKLLREVDFISIGTNDLIQYCLAADRSNSGVTNLYRASDPAVLRLIETTLKQANAAKVPVNLCGDMSTQPKYIPLLLGLGLRSMSLPPSAIPEIKQVCRSLNIKQCGEIAKRAMLLDSAREVDTFLAQEIRQVMPDLAP